MPGRTSSRSVSRPAGRTGSRGGAPAPAAAGPGRGGSRGRPPGHERPRARRGRARSSFERLRNIGSVPERLRALLTLTCSCSVRMKTNRSAERPHGLLTLRGCAHEEPRTGTARPSPTEPDPAPRAGAATRRGSGAWHTTLDGRCPDTPREYLPTVLGWANGDEVPGVLGR